jgi:hypothetical protein
VAAVCPAGACAGTLNNGIDVTGYTWASVADAVSLLNNGYGVTPPVPFTENFLTQEVDSAWAPNFFQDFAPLLGIPDSDVLVAYLIDDGTTSKLVMSMEDKFATGTADGTAPASGRSGAASVNIGALFWRTPTTPVPPSSAETVPTLSAYGLALTALGLFLIAARRLSRRQVKAG